jgi:hypothetical protein
MNEPEVKRIIVACDAQCDIDAAVNAAAELARRWRVPLHGIFLLDENLLRLAELPFSREVSLCVPDLSGTLEREELQRLVSAMAASMRRTVEFAAKRKGIDWSFREERDLPSVAPTTVARGDILVIDVSVRPFSGSWRPRSLREQMVVTLGTTVLLRRNEEDRRPSVVVILDTRKADHEKVSTTVHPLVHAQDRVYILMPSASSPPVDLDDLFGEPETPVDYIPLDLADLREQVSLLDPRLVALEISALEEEDLRAFIAATRCDVLLVANT